MGQNRDWSRSKSRVQQDLQGENAAAARHMAKQAARDEDSSDGVVPRAPSLRERIAKLLRRS
jgi:hypothetical protein